MNNLNSDTYIFPRVFCLAVGKTERGAGAGVGDQGINPGDWELRDHVTELCFDHKLY